ncbi:flagellar basal body-associated FliL family protein [Teredinibacter purpureus]|uniref:flagellar basal body-associated FliL family protein n=1 Tax=Teredinibacter purpureus TaxID=2731756 RepID=UPI0005F89367|nr:flagellar basal body-associated FliL family protein [Teredinibacter purpureus]
MADDDNTEGSEEAAPGGGKKKLITLIVMALVIAGISVGGTLAALKFIMPPPPEPTAEEGAEEDLEPPRLPAIYYPIKPAIIVNYDAKGRQRYLQAELTLMVREEDIIGSIELHMPKIRNGLNLLIGSQIYEEIQTAEGKELLRQQCLQTLQDIMQEELGKPGIEQVLFTNFVMQ